MYVLMGEQHQYKTADMDGVSRLATETAAIVNAMSFTERFETWQ